MMRIKVKKVQTDRGNEKKVTSDKPAGLIGLTNKNSFTSILILCMIQQPVRDIFGLFFRLNELYVSSLDFTQDYP